MKKIIFTILIILSIYSCQRKTYCERKAQKVARILKDCPGIIDTTVIRDTIIISDTFSFSIPAKIDTLTIDSLLDQYCNSIIKKSPVDSIKTRIIRERIYSQCTPEKVIGSGQKLLVHNGDTITIGYAGTKSDIDMSIISVKKQIQETRTIPIPCVDPDIWTMINKYYGLLLLLATAFFILGAAVTYRRR